MSAKPAPALDAVKAEATGVDEIAVEFEGLTLTVPADPQEWPVEALAYFEEGKGILAVKAVAGDQWPAITAKRATGRQMLGLFSQIAEAAGFTGPGESPAS